MEKILIGDLVEIKDYDGHNVVGLSIVEEIKGDIYTVLENNKESRHYKIDNKNYFLKKYEFKKGEKIIMEINNSIVITKLVETFIIRNERIHYMGVVSGCNIFSLNAFPLKIALEYEILDNFINGL